MCVSCPAQVSTREHKAKPALEGIAEKVQKVLERVCREVQKQARLYQQSVRDQVRQRAALSKKKPGLQRRPGQRPRGGRGGEEG